jgi:hypothetical protein
VGTKKLLCFLFLAAFAEPSAERGHQLDDGRPCDQPNYDADPEQEVGGTEAACKEPGLKPSKDASRGAECCRRSRVKHESSIDRITRWNELTVCDHKASKYSMKNEANFDVAGGVNGELLVESIGSLVVLEEQELIDPVQDGVEDAAEGVQDGHAGRVHQDTP